MVSSWLKGLPGSSEGKDSACNGETWVQSVGWEDPLEKGTATTAVFLPGEFHGQRNLAGLSPRGLRVGHDCAALRFTFP